MSQLCARAVSKLFRVWWCSMELLFLQHCLTSSDSIFTLPHKATKICYATCDLTHTYRPALSPGLIGETLCLDICGLFCTAPSCLKPADSSHFTHSEFCPLSRQLGRCAILCSDASSLCCGWEIVPRQKEGAIVGLALWVMLLSGIAVLYVCCLQSETVASYILFSFIAVYWERSNSAPITPSWMGIFCTACFYKSPLNVLVFL